MVQSYTHIMLHYVVKSTLEEEFGTSNNRIVYQSCVYLDI